MLARAQKIASEITVTDENGNARFAFTSGAEPYVLKGLPAGDYYLSELEPPKGFTVARDVLFTVSDNADAVNTVTMVDEQEKTAKGKLVVTKQLYDEAGKELQAQKNLRIPKLNPAQNLQTIPTLN